LYINLEKQQFPRSLNRNRIFVDHSSETAFP